MNKFRRTGKVDKLRQRPSGRARKMSAGYHFNVLFVLKWPQVSGAVVRRARLLGLEVGDDGAELEPLATSISLTGTRWTDYTRGGLRFDVTSYRKDLRATVLQHAGQLGDHPTYGFGLAHPERLGEDAADGSALDSLVGLWLHNGSLALRATDGVRGQTLDQETIVHFDVWDALADLFRLSLSTLTRRKVASKVAPAPTMGPAPKWAPGSAVRLLTAPWEARASVSNPCLFVAAGVSAIVEGDQRPSHVNEEPIRKQRTPAP